MDTHNSENNTDKFKGVGVALITPFLENGEIDFSSLKKLVDHVVDGGVDFLVALGTTSEAATLSLEERNAVIQFIVEQANAKLPVVVGLGSNNTYEAIRFLKEYNLKGVDAILSVSPFYNKPQQEGIYKHFEAISSACPLPIILYNVPARTSSNIEPDTAIRLANDCSNIIGIKEASGDMGQCMELINKKPKDFLLLSGEDKLTLPLMSIGADGVISVTANIAAKNFSNIVHACQKQNFAEAQKEHYLLLDLMTELFADGNPSGVKSALSHHGICGNNLRLPLVPVNKEIDAKLKEIVQELFF
ncbi:MAG: 4-hydroxy-tetrahydrodipicolinate synthase [Bacteroidales bacterium]